MDKVYVVTSGEYSDYAINKIFSNGDLAQEYIKTQDPEGKYSDQYRIEIYYLDEKDEDRVKRDVYLCEMDLESGNVINEETKIDYENINKRGYLCYIVDSYKYTGIDPYIYSGSFVSPEHAIKLAAELRQDYQRLKLYGQTPVTRRSEVELEIL